MALINCPECNNQISDKAKMCPHCGYELSNQEPKMQGVYCPCCLESGLKLDREEDNMCPFCHIKEKDSIYGTFDEVFNYGVNHPELKLSPEFSEEAYNKRINYVPYEYSSSAKCPTCSSQNIKRVSTTSKILNTAVFGIFGTKRHKQFHCNSCGYEW